MDNLTHILAGLLGAELVVQVRARRGAVRSEWARLAYFASAAGNNLPDLDFLYARLGGPKLGYLMHHRGHTHTLALGIPLGGALFAALLVWARRRGYLARPGDAPWLALLAVAGPLLHVFMDFSNSYGVHPFWPVDNRWFYGDRVFIVEPLFWAVGLPALWFAVKSRTGRVLLALWLGLTLTLPFVTRMVPVPQAIGIVLLVALFLALMRRMSEGGRIALGFTGSLALVGAFGLLKPVAESRARAALEAAFPRERIHDVVLTSNPADPSCWLFAAAQTDGAGQYAVRRGRVSLAPGLVPAERCARSGGQTTAPLRPIERPSTPSVYFERQFVAPLAELERLYRQSCRARVFLRFARLPFWTELPGTGLVLGDLRFDREPDLGFAELVVDRANDSCPPAIPPWTPPRAELLPAP
ncbi:MAG: metal-dependent hydrolase [Polyangiaceae bacterium]